MEIAKINDNIDNLCQLVANHHLSDVFKAITNLIDENKGLVVLKDKLRRQIEIYTNLLKYSFTEIKDPERDKVYTKLLKSIYSIIDEIKIIMLSENNFLAINTIKKEIEFELVSNRNVLEKKVLESLPGNEINKYFKHLWLSGSLQDNDVKFIEKIIRSKKASWVNESLIVSALTVSLLMNFDERKLSLLFDFYYKGTEKIWQRALVGIVFGIYLYSERLSEYIEIIGKINLIKQEKDFNKNLQYIILQIIRTKETEKISKKLHDEIIPEVAKFKPKIEQKLKLDDILQDPLGEDKNPDWEGVFGDSPELFNKLEEISKMQIEGSDVFMSAFALLKHFDFFKEPANWFLPFYKENEEIIKVFAFEKEGFNKELFIEGLEKSAFLCNSDKYSFVMNIRYMPDAQKNMMLEMFNAELESMNELIKDDELVNRSMLDKYVIHQYIQDLYRFYKLSPNKNEFIDIFNKKLDLYQGKILLDNWYDEDLFNNIGSLYFKKEFYGDAIQVFKAMIDKGFNSQSAFEKVAYSYQKSGDFENALAYYKKSELFDANLSWTFKKIALCYRELGNSENAIDYYTKAEKLEPENLYIQANMGHSYLRVEDYENALKHYFKVEYFAPSNTMILRPIAWCAFVLGKFENAIKYYNKLIEKKEADFYDYINLGHTFWCRGDIVSATSAYKQSIEIARKKGETIKKDFLDDKDFLVKHGIHAFEIELMLDYLLLDNIGYEKMTF